MGRWSCRRRSSTVHALCGHRPAAQVAGSSDCRFVPARSVRTDFTCRVPGSGDLGNAPRHRYCSTVGRRDADRRSAWRGVSCHHQAAGRCGPGCPCRPVVVGGFRASDCRPQGQPSGLQRPQAGSGRRRCGATAVSAAGAGAPCRRRSARPFRCQHEIGSDRFLQQAWLRTAARRSRGGIRCLRGRRRCGGHAARGGGCEGRPGGRAGYGHRCRSSADQCRTDRSFSGSARFEASA
ncbi:hypothetical protein YUYDRAFT_07406 [Streptomyces sp. ScaeMP-e48]|nr:hypothetical protein YUYDRAFT_07406 [Streptomyces sp. ScaeMP-e48]